MTGQKIEWNCVTPEMRKRYIEETFRYLQRPLWFSKFLPERRPPTRWQRIKWKLWRRHWWRFTDWTLPQGKTIWNSDGTIVTRAAP